MIAGKWTGESEVNAQNEREGHKFKRVKRCDHRSVRRMKMSYIVLSWEFSFKKWFNWVVHTPAVIAGTCTPSVIG